LVIGKGNIVNKIKEGCTELKALCIASGAGLGCGSCRSEVQVILEKIVSFDSNAELKVFRKRGSYKQCCELKLVRLKILSGTYVFM